MNFPSYLCNVNQKITIMAKAEYKNLTKDYRNMSLMSAVGIALSSWREGFGTNEYGEFDDNHKQLLFIKQHDPKFDLNSRIKEIMGQKYPKY